MADAIPVPVGQSQPQAQSTVIANPVPSQWQALKEAGWWTPFDWAMTAILLLVVVVTGFWLLFSHPVPEADRLSRLSALFFIWMFSTSLQLFWLISLVFRCSWFVLRAHADVALLPQASARIAVAFLSGQK